MAKNEKVKKEKPTLVSNVCWKNSQNSTNMLSMKNFSILIISSSVKKFRTSCYDSISQIIKLEMGSTNLSKSFNGTIFCFDHTSNIHTALKERRKIPEGQSNS